MTAKRTRYDILPARWPEDAEQARMLLADYRHYLESNPSGKGSVCLVGYEAELRSLPGKYATAGADLLLAQVDGEGAGCVAITQRVMTDGTKAAEMKRLWVPPHFRGLGIGRGLVTAAIAWTRAHGCSAVVLDTVNEAMPEAAELYRSLGFNEISRFNENPVPGVRFYQLTIPVIQ
jgi:ribosomal protein S18 acetylase RimI-like enzyme